MKSPEQIATEVVGKLVTDNGAVRRVNKSIIYRWVEQAIEIDRAQREEEPSLLRFSKPNEWEKTLVSEAYAEYSKSLPPEGVVAGIDPAYTLIAELMHYARIEVQP